MNPSCVYLIVTALLSALPALPALAAPPPSAPLSASTAVLLPREGTPWRVEEVAALRTTDLEGIEHLWVWNEATAPRRVAVAALDGAREADPERLKIVVPTRGTKIPPGFEVLAAPAAMWQEVPEALLPSWPVPPGGRVLLPVDPEQPWRVRLVGPETPARSRGTAWVEVPAGRPRILLEPESAMDRRVTVVDPEGQPLPATLTVLRRAEEGGKVVAQYAAATEGPLVLPRFPETDALHFLFTHPDHAPRALLGAPQHLPAVVGLERGVGLVGRFITTRGEPLAGVELLAQAWVPGAAGAVTERRATSAENGRVALASLPAGAVAFEARGPGLAPWRHKVEEAAGRIDLGDVVLAPGLSVPFTVVDETGTPVFGATLRGIGGVTAVTDRRGQGTLEGVPNSTFTVQGEAPGHLPAQKTLQPPYAEVVRLVLRRGFQVTGRLVTEEGLPVRDGTVRVTVGHSYRDETLTEDGTFDLLAEPETAVTLELRTSASVPVRLALEPGGAGEFRDLGDLVLDRGPVVEGRVVRASDGAPVPGARIWCPRPTGGGESVAWAQGDLVETRSRGDGTFTLSGLELRPVVLRVDARGYGREHLPIAPDPEAGFPDLGTVTLEAGTALRVVAGEDGEGALARVDVRNRWREPDMLTATIVDGEAVIEPVGAGPVTVTVLKGRDLLCEEAVEVAAGVTEQEVRCRAGGAEVRGTVLIGDRAARGGKLRWRAPSDHDEPGLILNRSTSVGLTGSRVYGSGRPPVDVAVEDDGTFHAALKAGAWEVAWISPSGGPASPPERVELQRGGARQVTLRFQATVVSGRVVDEEGQPVEHARIRQIDGGGFALSRGDGSFELVGLPEGEHTVQARLGEQTSDVTTVRCIAGERVDPLTLVVRPREPQTVRITVLDGDGWPSAGAFVFLEDDHQRRRILTTNLDGWVEGRLEEPVSQNYRVAAVEGGRWSFGPWVDRATLLDEGMHLTLKATGALRVSGEETGLVSVTAPGGWDLVALLAQLGERPLVQPEVPVVLMGLPAGQYQLHLGSARRTATVRGGDEIDVDFGGQ